MGLWGGLNHGLWQVISPQCSISEAQGHTQCGPKRNDPFGQVEGLGRRIARVINSEQSHGSRLEVPLEVEHVNEVDNVDDDGRRQQLSLELLSIPGLKIDIPHERSWISQSPHVGKGRIDGLLTQDDGLVVGLWRGLVDQALDEGVGIRSHCRRLLIVKGLIAKR